MNNIGVGIMCFGADKYFECTKILLDTFKQINTYVLTNQVSTFPHTQNTIKYDRVIKSYHDKIILVKEILKFHDTCIIIDGDALIKDITIIDDLLNYPFKDGITYIDYLHMVPYKTIGDIEPTGRWQSYFSYANQTLSNYQNLETIHEYFMVFKGNIKHDFFVEYEKLQIIKESCDVKFDKQILGAGEGVSIQIAANITNTPIRKDNELNKLIQNKIQNITQGK